MLKHLGLPTMAPALAAANISAPVLGFVLPEDDAGPAEAGDGRNLGDFGHPKGTAGLGRRRGDPPRGLKPRHGPAMIAHECLGSGALLPGGR